MSIDENDFKLVLRKLGQLLLECPDDKETRWLIERLKAADQPKEYWCGHCERVNIIGGDDE